MEFDDHQALEEDEEEEEMRPTASSAPTKTVSSDDGGGEAGSSSNSAVAVRYRECLKNQAVGIGGHAVDGCGEFIAAGEEGSLDALKCAACNCHRNFHRKEVDVGGGELITYHHTRPPPPQFSPYNYPPAAGYLHLSTPAPHRPLALPSTRGDYSCREEEDVSNPSSSGGGEANLIKKRHRTKFTAEQKEMMRRFSERLGWRIQKHDEAAVEQFCTDTGVKRKVLKVWMHNNKHTLGKEP
ncbi:Zinc-finger homeodomain protein 2 [Linum perenne]